MLKRIDGHAHPPLADKAARGQFAAAQTPCAKTALPEQIFAVCGKDCS
jgi:hypothetical protein